MFTTKHIQSLFNVASQTVRNWTDEFAEYLSPSASVQTSGGWRKYTVDDLAVFALIKELSEKGRRYPDIHATLKTGQRGEIPSISPAELNALLVGDVERDLAQQLAVKKEEVITLQTAIEVLKDQLGRKDHEITRLETQNHEIRKRVLQLEGALKTAQDGEKQAEYYRGQLELLKLLLQKKRP